MSKKTYSFGLEAWELMGLIVGLEIHEVNDMILLSHKLSILEDIKEIRIDQFSTNSLMSRSLYDKFNVKQRMGSIAVNWVCTQAFFNFTIAFVWSSSVLLPWMGTLGLH